METPKLPESEKAIQALPRPVEIVFSEEGHSPLAFVLPPFEDIGEIEGLKHLNFSIQDFQDVEQTINRQSFNEELVGLLRKQEKFRDSPAFASRVATLAHFAGDLQSEIAFIRRAVQLSKERFYSHRYGESLLAANLLGEAEAQFKSLDLEHDPAASLRLAYFCVHRGDYARAEDFVTKALVADSLDYNARLFDGGLKLVSQQYRESIHSFKAALHERPGSAVAHCNIAIAYVGLRENQKALTFLRKAVALDPLNQNALTLLSDIAFELKKDEEAIPSLRYFVQFEQKNAAIWSRLARSAFRLGKNDEAIHSLQRQASLGEDGAIWSNLGVVHQKNGQVKRAVECYNRAMVVENGVKGRTYFLAARNLIQMLSAGGDEGPVLSLAPALLAEDADGIIPGDDVLSDLVGMYVQSLYKSGDRERGEIVARQFLSKESISESLAVWLVGVLVGNNALKGSFDELLTLSSEHEAKVLRLGQDRKAARDNYFNNVAFAFAESGDVSSAERYLSRIANLIHKSAYPTATFGLINFKKGRVDRGVAAYEEAVRLAASKYDKRRIRQKLNLELGKSYLVTNEKRALRLLDKVISEQEGEVELARQARGVLKQLKLARPAE